MSELSEKALEAAEELKTTDPYDKTEGRIEKTLRECAEALDAKDKHMAFVQKVIDLNKETSDSNARKYDELKTLLKQIFSDITKDNRLSPDTFDRLVEALK